MWFGDFINTDFGSTIISIVLGLGLAAAFRKACSGDRCLVFQGPKPRDVKDNTYKIEEECYKYTPYVVPCNN
jgi:hypothetical protein